MTSNSGKRVEKVAISKQGTQYFAQREGEPSIYELDGKAVEDLQKAASDVKEAAPEPAKEKVTSPQRRGDAEVSAEKTNVRILVFSAFTPRLRVSALNSILTQ